MSHFNLENEISNALRMDAPICKGPQMRWQRKLNDSCNISRSESFLNASLNMSTQKTPSKKLSMNRSFGPLSTKTPGKTPTRNKTPGKGKTPSKGNKTPSNAADRFIPSRQTTQFDIGHHLLTSKGSRSSDGEEGNTEPMSPSKLEYQRAMGETLNGVDISSAKIISYRNKAPTAPEGYQNSLKVLYSATKTPGSCRKTARQIPQVPERILDAPELLDDYYLNLLDWSVNNQLAVCLGGHVYLWNASSGDISQLLEMDNPDDYVSSVTWIREGNFLAVGCSNGFVQLWDVEQQKRLRNMSGHVARVGAMSWNNHILTSGSRSGAVHHSDVRVADHLVGQMAAHTQEVCGLRWSPDGRYLATGGNDNLLHIWSAEVGQSYSTAMPVFTFSDHQAAVKALAWCPWQPSLLASGGGTADRHIRFWNVNTGTCLSSVDTKSQVCALLWSSEYKELISGHGFAQNQLTLWKYPKMTKVAELTGHTSRVLHMAMSPDGTTVVSAAADETLRLWKCFPVDVQKKMKAKVSSSSQPTTLRGNIR